jgi:hypothetical protein
VQSKVFNNSCGLNPRFETSVARNPVLSSNVLTRGDRQPPHLFIATFVVQYEVTQSLIPLHQEYPIFPDILTVENVGLDTSVFGDEP